MKAHAQPPRRILVLDFSSEGPVKQTELEFEGHWFSIVAHRIGWDFETGRDLVRRFDGQVDGIALGGVPKRITAGVTKIMHPGYLRLIGAATRSPLYVADGMRDFFADWTLSRLIKEQPGFFAGRKVLFHLASLSPFFRKAVLAGAEFAAADALALAGVPRRLESPKELERLLKVAGVLRQLKSFSGGSASLKARPFVTRRAYTEKTLLKWIENCDMFASFGNLLDRIENFESLRGKVVITDYVKPTTAERLQRAEPRSIVTLIPERLRAGELAEFPLALVAALLDQCRLLENSLLSSEEHLLKWVQETELRPNRVGRGREVMRRCAFIIHPLQQKDLWKIPGLSVLKNSPAWVRDSVERSAARAPIFHYGSLTGVKSQSTGQEAICDIYGILATPKQLLAMDEEFVYRRMIQAAEHAQKRGAQIFGLGAFTKVIGDAGVTIARGAPIPVTNGNSYSASTTLWAAREMVERLGLVPQPERRGDRMKAKAMVIGATGSIGRVSSLLVALVVEELVLVANQTDKLLELRQEILDFAPACRVRVTTNPDRELHDTDLVVTATSNTGGKILDIEAVKPGAVICDCSRPLDIGPEEAAKRPDVMVIESGEVLLPGAPKLDIDMGLPPPSVYACLAETVLLALDGRYENFSLSKQLSMRKVKEIYKIGLEHGAQLSEIRGPLGMVTEAQVQRCRALALQKLGKAGSVSGGLQRASRVEHEGLGESADLPEDALAE